MIRSLLIVLVAAPVVACVTSKPVAPLMFDFVRWGDDGLTMRIGESIVRELEASGEFLPRNTEMLPADIQVLLLGHAAWREFDGRVDASVTLEVRRSGLASTTSIRCYADEAVACGRAALEFVRQNTAR